MSDPPAADDSPRLDASAAAASGIDGSTDSVASGAAAATHTGATRGLFTVRNTKLEG